MSYLLRATGRGKQGNMPGKLMKWMDQVLSPGFHRFCPGGTWSPAINLYEDADCFYMVVDLAGVNSEQVDLRVEGEVMILSGERQMPQPPGVGNMSVHLMEIDYGSFCRSIELPQNVNSEGIQASYKCGYLSVRLPKKGQK